MAIVLDGAWCMVLFSKELLGIGVVGGKWWFFGWNMRDF
jgi:hypothetical protein